MAVRYHPKREKIRKDIAPRIMDLLFNNPQWQLDYNGMVILLDLISKHPSAPKQHDIYYGQALEGVNNAKKLLLHVGTQGSYYQKQAKQAITCCFMKLDNNYKLRNRKLIKKIIPHAPKSHNGNEWVKRTAK